MFPRGSRQPALAESAGEGLNYRGTASGGSIIDITSESALKDGELALIERVRAQMLHPDGTEHHILASTAETGNASAYLDLAGGAELRGAGEFSIESTGFRIWLEDGKLESLGEVIFAFDGGSGRAGSLLVEGRQVNGRDVHSWSSIAFSDGVEFIFQASPKEDP